VESGGIEPADAGLDPARVLDLRTPVGERLADVRAGRVV
jgi:hypothetical protein